MYENCKNNFSSTSQSITMLVASGIFWIIVVLVIERVRNWRVRKSETERYEIKKKEEDAVEEKIDGGHICSISTKNLVKVYGGKLEAVKGIEF
jgi:hypothetical protein